MPRKHAVQLQAVVAKLLHVIHAVQLQAVVAKSLRAILVVRLQAAVAKSLLAILAELQAVTAVVERNDVAYWLVCSATTTSRLAMHAMHVT
jgi:hypothetical protein